MARIELQNISIEFPVYNISSRNFKKHFLRLTTGGSVVSGTNQHRHIMVINALNNISLSFKDGDRVGLIGHNGCGKSTLLRLLAKIYEPTKGDIYIDGNVSPMLDITQGIEAEFTGYENILARGTVLGLSWQEIKQRADAIAQSSGLGDYLAMPMRTYSAGMRVRLAFAISTCVKPDILLIDEIFAAGDADFMAKARTEMASMLQQSSIVVMATHADALIRECCNKAVLLDGGKVKYFGEVNEALKLYRVKSTPQAKEQEHKNTFLENNSLL